MPGLSVLHLWIPGSWSWTAKDFFGNHVDIASVRVNVSPEKHKGIDMKTVLNWSCCGFAILGCSLVAHMVGTYGMKSGVDGLIVAGTVFPICLFGLSSIIYKFLEA